MSALDDPPKEEGGEDWLVTYADAITLLMAFFVLLYTVSEPNQHKFETKMGGVFEQFSGEKKAMPLDDIRAQVSTLISDSGEATEAKTTDRGISFEFSSAKMFAPGSAQILPGGEPLLDRVAQMVTFMGYDDYQVEVQGHTDDIPINTAPISLELGAFGGPRRGGRAFLGGSGRRTPAIGRGRLWRYQTQVAQPRRGRPADSREPSGKPPRRDRDRALGRRGRRRPSGPRPSWGRGRYPPPAVH